MIPTQNYRQSVFTCDWTLYVWLTQIQKSGIFKVDGVSDLMSHKVWLKATQVKLQSTIFSQQIINLDRLDFYQSIYKVNTCHFNFNLFWTVLLYITRVTRKIYIALEKLVAPTTVTLYISGILSSILSHFRFVIDFSARRWKRRAILRFGSRVSCLYDDDVWKILWFGSQSPDNRKMFNQNHFRYTSGLYFNQYRHFNDIFKHL